MNSNTSSDVVIIGLRATPPHDSGKAIIFRAKATFWAEASSQK